MRLTDREGQGQGQKKTGRRGPSEMQGRERERLGDG